MTAKTDKKYYEGVGRRKTAVARVRLTPSERSDFTVNGKTLKDYFKTGVLQHTAKEALETLDLPKKFSVSVQVIGGGISAQAEAVRHGIGRALVVFDQNLRREVKHKGFLVRDPRMVERKKFGLKKARKAPQWSKR